MDNLSDAYYLIQLILRQIIMFLRDFIFREFTWFTPTERKEIIDDASSKIGDVSLQHTAADFFILFIICGLLFAITILSGNSSKHEASNYDTSNVEMISMAFEDDPSSFWYSRFANSDLVSCFHSCDNLIGSSHNIIPEVQDVSCQATAKRKLTLQSKTASYARSSLQESQKTQTSRMFTSRMVPREWLVRRTRSGHVYGKYPI